MKKKSNLKSCLVIGASGRMGQSLASILSEKKVKQLIGWTQGSDANQYNRTIHDYQDLVVNTDLVIDFSLPEGFQKRLKQMAKSKTPYVCGVTGLSASDLKALKNFSKTRPVLWSSNMSLGIAVLRQAMKNLAAVKDFEFQISEQHHIHKKDRPSGTALTLQKDLETVVGRKLPDPLVSRGGGVIGLHQVWAYGPEETLMFEHQALQRSVFARGAVFCGEWLMNQKPGFYSIDEAIKSIHE